MMNNMFGRESIVANGREFDLGPVTFVGGWITSQRLNVSQSVE